MFIWFLNLVTKLWELLGYARRIHRREVEPPSVGQWSGDFKHAFGDVSYSAVQGRESLMECSEVDVCHNSTYIGVYDGHGGVDAARFISQNLLPNIIGSLKDGKISEEVVIDAFSRTEEGFIRRAQSNVSRQPSIYASGSSCLVALVWDNKLIIGHVGSSRALLGQVGYDGAVKRTSLEQLTTEHSVNLEHVRRDFWRTHGNDTVVQDIDHPDVWLIKGKTEVTRSIGDLYLKGSDYAITDQRSAFYLDQPIQDPLLTCNPTVVIRDIMPNQSFVVLASDGLWKYLSNDSVAHVVNRSRGHKGIAEKLVKKAIKSAMKKRERLIEQMNPYPLPPTEGPPYDDITVVVLFFGSQLLSEKTKQLEQVSVRPFTASVPSVMMSMLGGGEPTRSSDTASSSNVGISGPEIC